jgi:hypothetical protein
LVGWLVGWLVGCCLASTIGTAGSTQRNQPTQGHPPFVNCRASWQAATRRAAPSEAAAS